MLLEYSSSVPMPTLVNYSGKVHAFSFNCIYVMHVLEFQCLVVDMRIGFVVCDLSG